MAQGAALRRAVLGHRYDFALPLPAHACAVVSQAPFPNMHLVRDPSLGRRHDGPERLVGIGANAFEGSRGRRFWTGWRAVRVASTPAASVS